MGANQKYLHRRLHEKSGRRDRTRLTFDAKAKGSRIISSAPLTLLFFLLKNEFQLTASAGLAAAHAAIAASVADHDGAAYAAARRITHVIEIPHGVGCMIDAAI